MQQFLPFSSTLPSLPIHRPTHQQPSNRKYPAVKLPDLTTSFNHKVVEGVRSGGEETSWPTAKMSCGGGFSTFRLEVRASGGGRVYFRCPGAHRHPIQMNAAPVLRESLPIPHVRCVPPTAGTAMGRTCRTLATDDEIQPRKVKGRRAAGLDDI